MADGKENNEKEKNGDKDEEHGFSAAFGMAARLLRGIQHWVHWVITFQGILHNSIINKISFAHSKSFLEWLQNSK